MGQAVSPVFSLRFPPNRLFFGPDPLQAEGQGNGFRRIVRFRLVRPKGLQPLPLMLLTVNPVGNVSTTLTVVLVGAFPLLVAMRV